MNRVQGDYFETLLYKIFVSIDEYTDMKELSTVLQIDLEQVKVGHVISWRRQQMSFDVITVRMQCLCSFVLGLLTRRPHPLTPPSSMHHGAELLHHH